MRIRTIGRQLINEVKLRAAERLYGLAEKAVDRTMGLDLSATKRFISGKIEKSVKSAGFISVEEVAVAIKAINGKLKNAGGGQFDPGSWPVFTGFDNKYHTNQSAYIHFMLFLCRVGNGNAFNRIDFSPASQILFDRARGAGLLLELVNSSPVGIYAVAGNPIFYLHRQIIKLHRALRLIL